MRELLPRPSPQIVLISRTLESKRLSTQWAFNGAKVPSIYSRRRTSKRLAGGFPQANWEVDTRRRRQLVVSTPNRLLEFARASLFRGSLYRAASRTLPTLANVLSNLPSARSQTASFALLIWAQLQLRATVAAAAAGRQSEISNSLALQTPTHFVCLPLSGAAD